MYANKKEFDALHEAVDFIESRVDGAENMEPYGEMLDSLHSLFLKIRKERHDKHFKHLVKKELKKLTKK